VEQIVNRLDGAPPVGALQPPTAPIAPYKLPDAPPLSEQDVQRYGELSVRDAFKMLSGADEKEKSKTAKGSFNRLAASDYGRDAWITILSRLATRASAGLNDPDEGIKDEYAVKSVKGSSAISDIVRDGLHAYIMYDWRKRIDVAIAWLNEEWYNDTILAQSAKIASKANNMNGNAASSVTSPATPNYQRCALRLIDSILPYVEHTDKILLRFISEMPSLDHDILTRLIRMAEDPERIDLSCKVLQYLHMFRPPVRSVVVDILLELWKNNERAKPSAGKLLKLCRPDIALGETANGSTTPGSGGGEVKIEGAGGGGEQAVAQVV
jgi:symplekin